MGNWGSYRKVMPTFERIPDLYRNFEEVRAALRKAGLEKADLIVGIDTTKSNTWTGEKTFLRKNLHHVQEGALNFYQQALQAVTTTLDEFDDDKQIPAYRFGCSQTEDHSVLPLDPSGMEICDGFSQLLRAYFAMALQIQDKKIKLSGPTSFAPIIQRAIQVVKEKASFHILLVICDGQVDNVKETRQAILDARRVGLSIVIIGVGDGPFTEMKFLDDDLEDKSNPLDYDNTNFVNFNEIWSRENDASLSPFRFAWQVLMEIPQQYTFCKTHGLLERLKQSRIHPSAPFYEYTPGERAPGMQTEGF